MAHMRSLWEKVGFIPGAGAEGEEDEEEAGDSVEHLDGLASGLTPGGIAASVGEGSSTRGDNQHQQPVMTESIMAPNAVTASREEGSGTSGPEEGESAGDSEPPQLETQALTPSQGQPLLTVELSPAHTQSQEGE